MHFNDVSMKPNLILFIQEKLSESIFCSFFLNICLSVKLGESGLACFERSSLWDDVFCWWYLAVREVIGKKKIACSDRQTVEICPEVFFSKAEYAEKCE